MKHEQLHFDLNAKIFAKHLWNVPNVKICVLDICRVGPAIGDFDSFVGNLWSIS